MDITKLIADVRAKTTIEDSVTELLLVLTNDILSHPDDEAKNEFTCGQIVTNLKELSAAVAENT